MDVKPNKENLTLLTQHIYHLSDATKAYLDLTKTNYKYITDSDAHLLTDISEKINFLEVDELTPAEIIKNLK